MDKLVDDANNYFTTFASSLDSAVMSAAYYLANENATDEQIDQFVQNVSLTDNLKDTLLELIRISKTSGNHIDLHISIGAQ